MTFDNFTELMTSGEPDSGGLPFDNIFTYADGFCARQVASNDPSNLVFTWQYYHNCSSAITVPLRKLDGISASKHYLHYSDFQVACSKLNAIPPNGLLDLSFLLHTTLAILRRQRLLMAEDQCDGPLFVKAFVENVWRLTPYVDTADFVNFVSNHHFPVVQNDKIWILPGDITRLMGPLREASVEEIKNGGPGDEIPDALDVWYSINWSLGLSSSVVGSNIEQALEASDRAKALHAGR